MPDVVVIDSGGANLASLVYALRRIDTDAVVTTDAARIRAASHVILPGVGAAHDTMARLRAARLESLVPTLTQPVLGICLGMQLLFEGSEEAPAGGSTTPALGIVPGLVARMPASPEQPVPHMGWNQICARTPDPLLDGIVDGTYFYFVHSFAAPVTADTLATSDYGNPFCAIVRRGNFRGVQFHPERSAAAGSRLLSNFIAI